MQLNVSEIVPDKASVLQSQGMQDDLSLPDKINQIVVEAIDLFSAVARPVGLFSELTRSEFELIFAGEGNNEEETPVQNIFPQSENLALFAITMGSQVSEKITELFNSNQLALGAMLDAVASLAADEAAAEYEKRYYSNLSEMNEANADTRVLRYSPGYCGWHVSAQKQLFQFLKPERIGITLNNSFLMSPLKSITGVLIAGRKEIHVFKSKFPFCRQCRTFTCRQRIKTLLAS